MMALVGVVFAGVCLAWVRALWGVAVPQAALLLLAAHWLLGKIRRCERIFTPPLAIVAALAAWPWIQLAAGVSVHPWQTRWAALGWLANACAFAMAADLARSAANLDRLLRITLVIGAAIAILGTVQLFTSPGDVFWLFPSGYPDLVIGPFVYKNQYAAFVELLLPLAVATAWKYPSVRLPCGLVSGFLVASVLASGSRAGTALVIGELLALGAIGVYRRTLPVRSALLFAAAVATFAAALGPETLLRRLRDPEPLAVRAELHRASIDMIRDRPLTGFGAGTWPSVYPKFAHSDDGLYANRAHSDWLEWAVEGGLPFAGMLALLALRLAAPAVRSVWGLGVLAFWLHAIIDYPTGRPAIAVLFFFFLGLLASRRPGVIEGGS